MRKPAEGKLTLRVCFSYRMCRVYWHCYLTKHAVRLWLHFFTVAQLLLATVIPKNNVNEIKKRP